MVVSVGKGVWTLEELAAYLKRWGRFVMLQNQETRAIKVEIPWHELAEDDPSGR